MIITLATRRWSSQLFAPGCLRPIPSYMTPPFDDALQARLTQFNLEPFAPVLQYYAGVTHLSDVSQVSRNDQGVMIMKARQLWDLLGIAPRDLVTSLRAFFDLPSDADADDGLQ
jgi:hypothetical protein